MKEKEMKPRFDDDGVAYCTHTECPRYVNKATTTIKHAGCDELGRWPSRVCVPWLRQFVAAMKDARSALHYDLSDLPDKTPPNERIWKANMEAHKVLSGALEMGR